MSFTFKWFYEERGPAISHKPFIVNWYNYIYLCVSNLYLVSLCAFQLQVPIIVYLSFSNIERFKVKRLAWAAFPLLLSASSVRFLAIFFVCVTHLFVYVFVLLLVRWPFIGLARRKFMNALNFDNDIIKIMRFDINQMKRWWFKQSNEHSKKHDTFGEKKWM